MKTSQKFIIIYMAVLLAIVALFSFGDSISKYLFPSLTTTPTLRLSITNIASSATETPDFKYTQTPYTIIFDGFYNCRFSPSITSPIVVSIQGQEVTPIVKNQDENWLLVDVQGFGDPCWISFVDLDLNDTALADLPTIDFPIIFPTITLPPRTSNPNIPVSETVKITQPTDEMALGCNSEDVCTTLVEVEWLENIESQNLSIWVKPFPNDTDYPYYSQQSPQYVGNNTWKTTVYIGIPGDSNDLQYEIVAIITNDFYEGGIALPSIPVSTILMDKIIVTRGLYPDCTLPERPGNLSYIRNGQNFVLSWSSVESATSYEIFRSVNGGLFLSLGKTNSTSISDSIPNDVTYTYNIVAINSCGSSTNTSITISR